MINCIIHGMKLIIAGGRHYEFSDLDYQTLDGFLGLVTEVVSGGATGADACGERWAEKHDIPVARFEAEWDVGGSAAGPARNRKMAEYADAVILFPGGRGTENMRREARAAKIKLFEVPAPCFVCEHNIGAGCAKGMKCYPLERCGYFSREPGADDWLGEPDELVSNT